MYVSLMYLFILLGTLKEISKKENDLGLQNLDLFEGDILGLDPHQVIIDHQKT